MEISYTECDDSYAVMFPGRGKLLVIPPVDFSGLVGFHFVIFTYVPNLDGKYPSSILVGGFVGGGGGW